jgi:hypothetical protein
VLIKNLSLLSINNQSNIFRQENNRSVLSKKTLFHKIGKILSIQVKIWKINLQKNAENMLKAFVQEFFPF